MLTVPENMVLKIGGEDRQTPHLECFLSPKASSRGNDNEDTVKVVPDSGCTVPVIPVEMAKDHRLKITKVNEDEPDIQTYDGKSLKLVGQTKMFLRIR